MLRTRRDDAARGPGAGALLIVESPDPSRLLVRSGPDRVARLMALAFVVFGAYGAWLLATQPGGFQRENAQGVASRIRDFLGLEAGEPPDEAARLVAGGRIGEAVRERDGGSLAEAKARVDALRRGVAGDRGEV